MEKTKLAKAWQPYFLFAFIIIFVHFIRYANLFFTMGVPYNDRQIDYFWYSNYSLTINIICLIISLILFYKRKKFPILTTTLIWAEVLILLSHEVDRYVTLGILSLLSVLIMSIFWTMIKTRKG